MATQKSVVIFGAGIAGLTAAHEFSKLGYNVRVYEANSESGGFFRSARKQKDKGIPSEYSWHGIGPWYHNVFKIFKEIKNENNENLYDTILTRPIDFGLAFNNGRAQFDDHTSWLVDVRKMFRLSVKDKYLVAWLMLKVWCAQRRSREYYSTLNAKKAWTPYLSEQGLQTWSSTFDPWIGSDWFNVSLHQAGHFFRKQLISKPTYLHKADTKGGPWKQRARSGWLLLNGPSSEVWFDQWIKYLNKNKVDFFWEKKLSQIELKNTNVKCVSLENGEKIYADIYVMAINPFYAAEIIDKTPLLKQDSQLKLLRSLVSDGPHYQVSLRIAFKEKILWPRTRCALIISDSAFNLTLFAQELAWSENIDLGDNVNSLWTITACVSKMPGPLFGIPLETCTKEQFIDEVLFQLKQSESLSNLIKNSNEGKDWIEFSILKIEVWDEWKFSPEGIKGYQPKWVNSYHNQKYIPEQKTSLSNFVMAGAHTKTEADVWSIEAAVESGLRAARIFEPQVQIIPQYRPFLLKMLWELDDVLFFLKLPNILDVIGIFIIISILLIGWFNIFS